MVKRTRFLTGRMFKKHGVKRPHKWYEIRDTSKPYKSYRMGGGKSTGKYTRAKKR